MFEFISVGILFILAVTLCLSIYLLTSFLGPNNPLKAKLSTYECGVTPESDARIPFNIRFYLLAVLFLLFDVEAVFFLPWALVYRESLAEGPTLYFAMLLYLFFFVLALFYVFRRGILRVR